jgi:hypothetical protein
VLKEIGTVPMVRLSGREPRLLTAEILPVFSAALMQRYGNEGGQPAVRLAVQKAAKLLKEPRMRSTFEDRFTPLGNDARTKEIVFTRQKKPAMILVELEETLAAFEAAAGEREHEPSARWRANFDYVRGLVEQSIAFVYEYDYMLAQIRNDAMPPRDPSRHTGWRLVSRPKLQSGGEAKKQAAHARKLLLQLVEEHKGTPWEVLARRAALTEVGLEWQPAR